MENYKLKSKPVKVSNTRYTYRGYIVDIQVYTLDTNGIGTRDSSLRSIAKFFVVAKDDKELRDYICPRWITLFSACHFVDEEIARKELEEDAEIKAIGQ